MKKELIIVLLLLLLSFPAIKSLFIPGGYTSHDLTYHIMRQISMDKLLEEGQFPPRWSGELNNGYGYPVFIFNYQLPSLIGEVFHKLGFNFVDSVKAVFVLSQVFSILGMYFFLKELLNSRLTSFLGAVFYLYAPIRFLNVYVAAAVGAALSAGILPFVFYFMVVLSKQNLKNKTSKILLGSLSFSLLILSHNFTTFIFAPVILAFGGFLIWQSKEKLRVFRNFGVMFLLGLGLSAWFWVPAVFEKQYIRFNQFYQDFYKNQFITIPQLIHSPWGYGLSHPQKSEPGDMSYQLGLVHILVTILFAFYFIFFGRKQKDKILSIFVLLTFTFSVFLMLKESTFIWEALPVLSIVQFPLRFEIVAVFCASMAAALLIKHLPFKKMLVVFLLLLVLYANRNHLNINEVFDPGEEYYLSLQGITSPYGEDLPKWGKPMEKKSPSKIEFVEGGGSIRMVENKSSLVLAEIEATKLSSLKLNQFYFPGWGIKVDDKLVSFNYLSEGESYGLPIFDIDSGKHLVKAEFKNTTIRNIADGVGLLSLGIWLLLFAKYRRRLNSSENGILKKHYASS